MGAGPEAAAPACRGGLLRVAAVAGKPLPLAQAGEAAELTTDGPEVMRMAWLISVSVRAA